ncbi:Myotubularin-Related Protein 5 [Manis pentadactyla]|nr:Myotubularin-Related Protein 5 [Manis pentadactyla]
MIIMKMQSTLLVFPDGPPLPLGTQSQAHLSIGETEDPDLQTCLYTCVLNTFDLKFHRTFLSFTNISDHLLCAVCLMI